MFGSLSNLPVGAPRSLFLATSSNFRSISGDRSLNLSQHSQLDTLHQSYISNISQTGLHLSKQLLTLKWARQVSSCSHTVSMGSSDFHWGNPPRPCAKMFWLMSWNSGWAFLSHRFNKVHNVIWGQSCKLPASNHAKPQKTEDFKGPVCAMRSNLNISNFDLQMPNKSQKAITVFALSDTKDKPTLAANHDGTWMQWVRWCQERN